MADPKQTALKAKITRLRNRSKDAGMTLTQKVAAKEMVKAAEQELRDYRLKLAAEKAEAKALPKRIKATKKAFDNVAREIARAACREACKKPPAEFQQWGHTRTMAWLKLAQQGNRLVKRLRPTVEDLQSIVWRMSQVPSMDLQTCQQIINPPKK